MTCEHPVATRDPELAPLLAKCAPEILSVVRAMASRGGGPSNACVVLTDVGNVGWFYPVGHEVVRHTRASLVDDAFPVQLGRELPEVLSRVDPECPACGRALRSPPRGHVALYGRIGPAADPLSFTGSWPFPSELEGLRRRAPERRDGVTLIVNDAEQLYLPRRRS